MTTNISTLRIVNPISMIDIKVGVCVTFDQWRVTSDFVKRLKVMVTDGIHFIFSNLNDN